MLGSPCPLPGCIGVSWFGLVVAADLRAGKNICPPVQPDRR
jgi:hypothetical protein